jgi:hypothetical protein
LLSGSRRSMRLHRVGDSRTRVADTPGASMRDPAACALGPVASTP